MRRELMTLAELRLERQLYRELFLECLPWPQRVVRRFLDWMRAPRRS